MKENGKEKLKTREVVKVDKEKERRNGTKRIWPQKGRDQKAKKGWELHMALLR